MPTFWIRRLRSVQLRPRAVAANSRWTLAIGSGIQNEVEIGDHVALVIGSDYMGTGIIASRSGTEIELEIVAPSSGGLRLVVPYLTTWTPVEAKDHAEFIRDFFDPEPVEERAGPDELHPWHPDSVPDGIEANTLKGFSYTTVDEIVDDRVALQCACWPNTDEAGRLHFGEDEARLVGVGKGELERFLGQTRLLVSLADAGSEPTTDKEDLVRMGAQARMRKLAIGDVFAMPWAVVELADNGPLVEIPPDTRIIDLTAEARERAKLAVAGARAEEPLRIIDDVEHSSVPRRALTDLGAEYELSGRPSADVSFAAAAYPPPRVKRREPIVIGIDGTMLTGSDLRRELADDAR